MSMISTPFATHIANTLHSVQFGSQWLSAPIVERSIRPIASSPFDLHNMQQAPIHPAFPLYVPGPTYPGAAPPYGPIDPVNALALAGIIPPPSMFGALDRPLPLPEWQYHQGYPGPVPFPPDAYAQHRPFPAPLTYTPALDGPPTASGDWALSPGSVPQWVPRMRFLDEEPDDVPRAAPPRPCGSPQPEEERVSPWAHALLPAVPHWGPPASSPQGNALAAAFNRLENRCAPPRPKSVLPESAYILDDEDRAAAALRAAYAIPATAIRAHVEYGPGAGSVGSASELYEAEDARDRICGVQAENTMRLERTMEWIAQTGLSDDGEGTEPIGWTKVFDAGAEEARDMDNTLREEGMECIVHHEERSPCIGVLVPCEWDDEESAGSDGSERNSANASDKVPSLAQSGLSGDGTASDIEFVVTPILNLPAPLRLPSPIIPLHEERVPSESPAACDLMAMGLAQEEDACAKDAAGVAAGEALDDEGGYGEKEGSIRWLRERLRLIRARPIHQKKEIEP